MKMTSHILQMSRTLKTQAELHELYGKPQPEPKQIKQKIKDKCSVSAVGSYVLSLFPILKVIRTYKVKEYILPDIISGLSVSCLHFPQGLAFGILASLKPANGLYTSFFPVLFYMIFGTSQHVSLGTSSIIAILVAELVDLQFEKFPYAPVNKTHVSNMSLINFTTTSSDIDHEAIIFKASVAAGSSFIVGILLLGMGLCRLGFITSYLSSSFIAAFTTTGAIHIISSQIPNSLGIKIPTITVPGNLIYKYIEIFKAFPQIHVGTLITSILSVVILVFVKDFINRKYSHKLKVPIPIDFILVVLATTISHFAKLHENFGINVVGEISTGLPSPALPRVTVDLIEDSIVIGIIVFVLTIAMARICEVKHDYSVDDNQELVAYGIANVGSAFFSCFPCCVAPPRTIILSTTGAKTTLNGLVSAFVILLIIMFIGTYLESTPNSVLAVMVIVAVKNLLSPLFKLRNLWQVNRYDFFIFMGTLLSGVVIDFHYSLYVGVLLCFLTVVIQSQLSSVYKIGKLDNEDRLLDTKTHDVTCNPKIAIFRMESSIYFATADRFKRELYKSTIDPKEFRKEAHIDINALAEVTLRVGIGDDDTNDKTSLSNSNVDIKPPTPPLSHIIIDCSSVNYIDMNGLNTISQINSEFRKIGVTLLFGNCTEFVKISLEKSPKVIETQYIYADILDAYLAITQEKIS